MFAQFLYSFCGSFFYLFCFLRCSALSPKSIKYYWMTAAQARVVSVFGALRAEQTYFFFFSAGLLIWISHPNTRHEQMLLGTSFSFSFCLPLSLSVSDNHIFSKVCFIFLVATLLHPRWVRVGSHSSHTPEGQRELHLLLKPTSCSTLPTSVSCKTTSPSCPLI